jgi:hypothetical protein
VSEKVLQLNEVLSLLYLKAGNIFIDTIELIDLDQRQAADLGRTVGGIWGVSQEESSEEAKFFCCSRPAELLSDTFILQILRSVNVALRRHFTGGCDIVYRMVSG